jgi:hypothetical protein
VAKAGVPINAMAAIAVASFLIPAPKTRQNLYHAACWGLLPLQHSEGENRGAESDQGFRDVVRFTPNSGHWQTTVGCPLCAKSCREQAQQKFTIETSLFDYLVGGGGAGGGARRRDTAGLSRQYPIGI